MPAPTVLPTLPDLATSVRLMVHAFTHGEPTGKRGPALVLDLCDVKAPTASGLGQLVALHTRLLASGGHLVLCNVGERAYETFEVTRLTELLDVRRAGIVRPAPDDSEGDSLSARDSSPGGFSMPGGRNGGRSRFSNDPPGANA